MQTAPFITFWSAHGGVGRTLAVWNLGHLLAARGLRVLLVDLDLDSPGLSRLVGEAGEGVVELLAGPGWSTCPVEDVARCCVTVATPGVLRVLRAGRLDASYWDRLDAWAPGDRARATAELRRQLVAADVADLVLVDVGAGLSRAAERSARVFGEAVWLFTGLNQQHVGGTAELLGRCRDAQARMRVVLAPLPLGEDELTAAREEAAREAFTAAWGGPIDLSRRISHHPRLLLHEQPHAARERGLVAYAGLAREVLADAGFEVPAILQAIEAALAEPAWGRALALLRVMVVVDPAGEALAATYAWLRERLAPDPASDALFELLAEALPVSAPAYARFATGLHRAGNPLARRFYERLVADAPGHADMLGNFAACLTDVCGEHDLAETYYERALAAAPDDADHRGNYANFLALVRADPGRADACYRATIAAAPDDAHHLGNYANFRVSAFADVAGAEALYRRALAAEPDDANLLGNCARLLFATGRGEEGRALLERALALAEDDPLRCELLFYAYAHAPALRPEALAELGALLSAGVRSPGWDLGANVEQARRDGHPAPELLAALARVIADEAPLEVLA